MHLGQDQSRIFCTINEINEKGYLPNPQRVDKFLKYPKPEIVVELKRFLGTYNYY